VVTDDKTGRPMAVFDKPEATQDIPQLVYDAIDRFNNYPGKEKVIYDK